MLDKRSPVEQTSPHAGTAEQLRIGDVASRAGVSVEALRYYERLGLLRPAGRKQSGYRQYSDEAPQLVRFIKRAQSLGFTLAEIGDLVRLRGGIWTARAARQLRAAAAAKILDVDRRIADLNGLRKALDARLRECDAFCTATAVAKASDNSVTVAPEDCPLVAAFESERRTNDHDSRTQTNPDHPPAQREGRPPTLRRRATKSKPTSAHHSQSNRRLS